MRSHNTECCCYILITNDGHASYCGTTNDFNRRLLQHQMGHRAGGARYTSARRHRMWKPLCVVRGFLNRSQCLSFEWRLKRMKAPPSCRGSCIARRCAQLMHTLESQSWWLRYPPCPPHMHVEWLYTNGSPPLSLMNQTNGSFEVTIVVAEDGLTEDSHNQHTHLTTDVP